MFTGPFTTRSTLRAGDTHLGVWSLQVLLNDIYLNKLHPLDEDGVFGSGTEATVKKYQGDVGIKTDGVVGPHTQKRLVRSAIVRSTFGAQLPKGLLEGQIALESGGILSAVNDSVPGGVDLGLVQQRVYGPPYSESRVKEAMDPIYAIGKSAEGLYRLATTTYSTPHANCPFNKWELAVLHHNWPYAASQYDKYGKLPSPNRNAGWAPASLQPITWDEWARFYVSKVTALVEW